MAIRTNRINADMSDPDRTHGTSSGFYRYGHVGMVERGIEHLMANRRHNICDGSLAVQARVLLADVAAALDAAGLDPEDLMRGAMHNVRHAKTTNKED